MASGKPLDSILFLDANSSNQYSYGRLATWVATRCPHNETLIKAGSQAKLQPTENVNWLIQVDQEFNYSYGRLASRPYNETLTKAGSQAKLNLLKMYLGLFKLTRNSTTRAGDWRRG
jgi:hypothetical protein